MHAAQGEVPCLMDKRFLKHQDSTIDTEAVELQLIQQEITASMCVKEKLHILKRIWWNQTNLLDKI